MGDIQKMMWQTVAESTETVDDVEIFLTRRVNDARGFELEIYDLDALNSQEVQTATFRPSSTAVSIDGRGYDGAAFTAANLWNLVNDSVPVPGTYTFPSGLVTGTFDADWLGSEVNGGNGQTITFKFASLAATLPPDALIIEVRLRAIGQVLLGNTTSSAAALSRPVVIRDGYVFYGEGIFVGSTASEMTATYNFDPRTKVGWRLDDVELFDAAGAAGNSIGWNIYSTGSEEVTQAIYQVYVEVDYLDADPRVALGTFDVGPNPILEPGWRALSLETPAGVAGWAKVSGESYGLCMRDRSSPSSLYMRYLSGGTAPQQTTGMIGTYDESDTLFEPEEDLTQAPAVIYVVGAGSSDDSQPYASIDGDRDWMSLGAAPTDFWCDVGSNNIAEQDLLVGGTPLTVGYLHATAKGDLDMPTEPLVIGIYRRSDDVLMAGPFSFEGEDVLGDDPLAFVDIETTFTPVVLAANTKYYVKFTCTETNGWKVLVLSDLFTLAAANGPPPGANDTTYGGIDGRGRWRGVYRNGIDYAVTLHTVPATIAGFAINAVAESGCLDHVELDWDAVDSSGCGGFARYELERSVDGTTWHPIAYIEDETVSMFDDHEARRNVEEQYRIRWRREDGAFSAWSDTKSATATMDCCGYVFTSNEVPEREVWYDDLRPRTYDLLENVILQQYESRDFQVAYQELVDRGDRISVTLLIAAQGGQGGTVEANPVGRQAFDPLSVLAGNKRDRDTGEKVLLPYLCVLDSDGNRWFANVQTPNAVRDEPGGSYTMDVVITEIASVPIPLVIAGPAEGS